jgi:hypothetical protein
MVLAAMKASLNYGERRLPASCFRREWNPRTRIVYRQMEDEMTVHAKSAMLSLGEISTRAWTPAVFDEQDAGCPGFF